MKVLWATKKGDEDWKEQLITEHAERIPAARKWAVANGYDRLRVVELADEPEKPDFAKCINV